MVQSDIVIVLSTLLIAAAAAGAEPDMSKEVFLVPNFHPASCGWLTDFSTERNYCANSYLDHLDRTTDDERYAFVISEVNNMIAIMNFTPGRFEELKKCIADGRVEAVNAFFLESTICLSGGEALVKQGVEGLRWQEALLGVQPRHLWAIDVTGMHEQMAQIANGLGLETLVHCRMNNFGSTMYWAESPDGTRILTVAPGHYNEWHELFKAESGLSDEDVRKLIAEVATRERRTSVADVETMRTPGGAPTLVLCGSGDYSLAPACKEYPARLLGQWREAAPEQPLRFTTLGAYLDVVRPGIESGDIAIPDVTGGWNFAYKAFWIQNPLVKQRYRISEHALQAAEMLATIATAKQAAPYPAQDLYHAWLLMLLNMDRNTLWGAAGGMVFEHAASWDAKDRFDWVDAKCAAVSGKCFDTVCGEGEALVLFNPANWKRSDPVVLPLDGGMGLENTPCQVMPGGTTLCNLEQPSVGLTSRAKKPGEAKASEPVPLPETIETPFYTASIDPETGDLTSLRLKASGEELLAGPANVLVAETPSDRVSPGNHMVDRPERKRLTTSSQTGNTVKAFSGPLATIVEARGPFCEGKEARRVVTFYHDCPRIDFDTYLEDIPDATLVLAEFPLAPAITEARRGIPYGFAHGAWPEPASGLTGYMKGITPAVRWSHYTLENGAGMALFDRGLSGREIDGNTPVIYLINAVEKYNGYPCAWLSGHGKHHLQYALLAHGEPWEEARLPQRAWEYTCPPVAAPAAAPVATRAFVETSPNLIMQAMRREGDEIEIRLAECLGLEGEAKVRVNLPHEAAATTNLCAKQRHALPGGPDYQFPVRPQQIVTLRFKTTTPAADIEPLTDWAPLVPEHKRPALRTYKPGVKGHPPHG